MGERALGTALGNRGEDHGAGEEERLQAVSGLEHLGWYLGWLGSATVLGWLLFVKIGGNR
jgi:hypothetical protein